MMTKATSTLKKAEAKKLYVEAGLTAKEISEKIQITEKSIGVWVKTYGWKVQRKIKENKKLGLSNREKLTSAHTIADLKKHIKKQSPLLFRQVLPLIDNFLQSKY